MCSCPTTERLLPDDTRATAYSLNYPGHLKGIDPYQPLGPNRMQEIFWPVEVEYDPETNRSRLGLSLLAPPEGDQ